MKVVFIILTGLFLVGCSAKKSAIENAHEHEHEGLATTVTEWSDDFELFAEIAPLVVGEHVDAIIHLTRLSDYKPVAIGSVRLVFHPHAGEAQPFVAELSKPGIFISPIEMAQAGLYDVEIIIETDETTVAFDAGHIQVYADDAEMERLAHNSEIDDHNHAHARNIESDEKNDHTDEHESGATENIITFLKEQQWRTDFATTLVQEREVVATVMAVSEIIPHQHGYAEVVAPVDGLLLVEHNQEMAVPGKHVKKGDQLLVLCPPIGASNTWLDRQLEFERAKREFERAEKLYARDAISQREYEQIKQTYIIEKTSYETLLQNFSAGELQAGSSCLLLRSPIDGIVADIAVLPGQNISAGQQLLKVIDPSIVWIRSQIFEKDMERLGHPAGLSIRLQGSDRLIEFNKNDFELLSKGVMIDPATRTIPVVFEVKNPDNRLKIGQIVQTEIHTTQSQNMLAVPASAVIDEEIDKIVFIQVEGESFEKRSVRTGPVYGDWVAILDGLDGGERIVTKGAYAVKLASANVSVGGAHVH